MCPRNVAFELLGPHTTVMQAIRITPHCSLVYTHMYSHILLCTAQFSVPFYSSLCFHCVFVPDMTHDIEFMTTNGEHGAMSQSYGVWKVIINSGLLFPTSNPVPPPPPGRSGTETHMYEENKVILRKQVGRFHHVSSLPGC